MLLLVLAATFAAFSSSLDNGFINWDDKLHLLENPAVVSLDAPHLKRHFTSSVNNTYIPLTTLSFAVEHFFAGWNPFIYHLDNVLLHLLVTAFVFQLGGVLGLSLYGRFWAALLFGIHPMHVESVVWVTERKDVLYSVFYLLAVIGYCRYILKGSLVFYWGSVVFGLLSILAKPMAISLPLILFVCDWYFKRKWDRKAFEDKLLFFVITGAIGVITLSQHARVSLHDWIQGIHVFVWSSTFYIKKFFVPDFYTPLYDWPNPVNLSNVTFQTAYGILLIYSWLLFIFRRNRLFVFATVYYLASSFFLFRFDLSDVNVVADRFMYLPSLGYCFLIGEVLRGWIKKSASLKLFKVVLATSLFAALALKTFVQADLWQESLRLWNYTLKYNPQSTHATLYRAESYNQSGQYDLAIADCNRVLNKEDVSLRAPEGRSNLLIDRLLRRPKRAPRNDISVLNNNSQDFLAYYTRAMSFSQKGDAVQALKDFQEAENLNPLFKDIYLNRGSLFLFTGNWKFAVADFSHVLNLDPFNFRALNYRATAYSFLGESSLALKDFDAVLKIYPEFVEVYINRGTFWAMRQEFDKAIADFSKAIVFYPDNAMLFYNRSLAYKDSGQKEQAHKDALTAQRLGFPVPEDYWKELK